MRIYISSLEDMMNKHLHNIHFILSILVSLKHMELCNEFSIHIERMKRKIHIVTRYTLLSDKSVGTDTN